MNIAIIGSGGVGGYFGGRLAKDGNNVTFVARGKHAAAMQKNGLIVKSAKGDFTVENPNVVTQIKDIKEPDLILVAVKAWQVAGVAKELKNVVQKETAVIPLQNGVMSCDELLAELEPQNVIGGLCRIFSKIESPGVINHMSLEPTIVFGELNDDVTGRLVRISQVFTSAGINHKLSDNVRAEIWKKFMMICLGGLGALTRSNFGVLTTTPALREMLIKMLDEMYEVSQKENVKLLSTIKQKILKATDNFNPESNSSMARDIWNGLPSELEYQNGTVVKLAEKHNIKVPISYFVYHCLLPQEKKARNLN